MTMQEKQSFDYTKVPHGYVHCFIDSCPRAGECLRRLTARNAPATVETVRCVNPAAVPADKARCPYYRTTRKITLAWGLKHLLDDLPYNTAVSVNRDVRRLWAHTSYQRMAWKSHATLTLLAKQDLPTFGYNMIAPLKSWCWGSILFSVW